LPNGQAYWTVVDGCYSRVEVADRFLFDLRFGRDRAESTSRMYAGELARFLIWCVRSGRSLEDGARDLSRFGVWLRTTPTSRPEAGQGRPPGPGRINHILGVVREFFKRAVADGAVDGSILAALYEGSDDRHLPVHLRDDRAGLSYRARPRHRLRVSHPPSPDAASRQEWEALLVTAASWRDRFLLLLLWFTGLRIGEALGLRHSDLHFMDSSTSLGCRLEGPHLHRAELRVLALYDATGNIAFDDIRIRGGSSGSTEDDRGGVGAGQRRPLKFGSQNRGTPPRWLDAHCASSKTRLFRS
jgi:hypothetical protein